ncbi:hypothetical protein [Microvirga tunisiensis]|uniref:Uncharacterized protein n=1 Tax=Microvirga tunisiensis TaxID=2108360 RepID=A0A5N7MTA2_9HYPH|nr:hypothetical protein [Microvirga tunisiensis]MPR09233.1 hypothetical protein [Microvirga tunisiensis]MPR29699.1 hypothetical protein [Microvirga tunisiensis]
MEGAISLKSTDKHLVVFGRKQCKHCQSSTRVAVFAQHTADAYKLYGHDYISVLDQARDIDPASLQALRAFAPGYGMAYLFYANHCEECAEPICDRPLHGRMDSYWIDWTTVSDFGYEVREASLEFEGPFSNDEESIPSDIRAKLPVTYVPELDPSWENTG